MSLLNLYTSVFFFSIIVFFVSIRRGKRKCGKHYLGMGDIVMKMKNETTKAIIDLLEAEIDVISRIYDVQKALHEKVIDKDWEETKTALLKINGLVAEFSRLDKHLDGYVTSHGEESVFSLVQNTETDERKELTALCSMLKRKLTLSKYENEAFNNYVLHAQTLAEGVVGSLQEATSGSTYCYNGSRRRPVGTTGGLVLNQVL